MTPNPDGPPSISDPPRSDPDIKALHHDLSPTPDPRPPAPTPSRARGRWGLVAACAALMATTSGVWYTASVFFLAFIQEFRWDYASTAGIFSLFTILYGIAGVCVGYLADRIGPRRVIVGGGVLLASALVGSSLAGARWHLYVTHSALTALGLAGMGWVPVSILLARAFQQGRGLAVGFASAGVGLGITIFVPLTQAIIDHAGWRMAYVTLSAVALVVILPVGLFALRSYDSGPLLPPPSGGSRPSTEGGPRQTPLRGWTMASVLRSREFWLITATFTFLNSPVQMVLTHQVAHLVEVGQPKVFVAGIVGLVGLVSVPGKVLWGFLSDRWWIETTYLGGIAFLMGGIVALLAIGPVSGDWALYLYAALMGIGYAVSPAMTPVLGARFFSGTHFGAIFGGLNLVHHLGGASGVWLAGYAHDLTGSYTLPFLLAIASAVVALLSVWLAAPRRVRP